MSANTPKRLIGQMLIEAGIITEDQLTIGLTEQRKEKQQIGKILVKLGFVSEAVMRDFVSSSYEQDSVDLSKIIVDREAIHIVPKALARRHKLLPISWDVEERNLMVAMADVYNVVALDQVKASAGGNLTIQPLLASESEILHAIDNVYGFDFSLDGILNEIETGEVDYQSIAISNDEYSQPLVRLVDVLLADAVKRGASDIHFEPEETFFRIRYRIDGVLQQIRSLHKEYWGAIAVRIKVMASLNIAENRIPQDGRISMNLSGRPIDFRVSVQPTVHGENIVLRILDRERGLMPLEQMGLTEDAMRLLTLMIARPEGMIMVTGPTGSGKTTTLYSILRQLNTVEVNIMTLEDPVEYHIGMVRQTAINEAVNLDFSSGVRSMLRQDPDIILVGEIRDQDTAEMGFRAAMTGHQVYSTLHTNSALGAVPRLLDLGVLPDIMADNIIGVIGQRLVRKLCNECKAAYTPSEMEQQLLGMTPDQKDQPIYKAVGCEACDHRGYKGRLALMEIIRMEGYLEALIAERANIHILKQRALERGFSPLAEDGSRRVLAGITSLDEVSRVINMTERLS